MSHEYRRSILRRKLLRGKTPPAGGGTAFIFAAIGRGTLTVVGQPPAVLSGINLDLAAGTVTVVGLAPAASTTTDVARLPAAGTVTATGLAPAVSIAAINTVIYDTAGIAVDYTGTLDTTYDTAGVLLEAS